MEAGTLKEIVLYRTPESKSDIILREQTIGEIRGLERLSRLVEIELDELREKLKSQDQAT